MLRLFAIPSALVDEVKVHADYCPYCRDRQVVFSDGWTRFVLDTRLCDKADALVEKCINYETAKRHPNGAR